MTHQNEEFNISTQNEITSLQDSDLISYLELKPKIGSNYTHLKTTDLNYSYSSCVIYLICALLFILWTLDLLSERWNQIVNPVSSTGFDITVFQELLYPEITICGISPEVTLKHNKCKNIYDTIECTYKESNILSSSKLRKKPSHCITYNNRLDSAFIFMNKGVDEILFFSLSLNNTNIDHNFLSSKVIIYLHSQSTPIVL